MLTESISLPRRVAVHAALADSHRLRIVDELAMSDRSPSELGGLLQIGSNLLAHHLQVLEDAALIERLSSSGDGRRKYLRLIPSVLATIASPLTTLVARDVLFVCSANSARSQLAAAVWNARHEVPASSAGTHPATAVRPGALRAAARAGLDLSAARPRSIPEVTKKPDLVVTVCDVAHEALDDLPSATKVFHWSVPDPSESSSRSAYDEALSMITTRIEVLAPHVRAVRRPRRSRR